MMFVTLEQTIQKTNKNTTMAVTSSIEGSVGKIFVTGQFGDSSHRDFSKERNKLWGQAQVKDILIDFAQVDFMEDSGFTILSICQALVDEAGKTMALTRCNATVRYVLEMSGCKFTIV
jgi:anti-anti-sigma factor